MVTTEILLIAATIIIVILLFLLLRRKGKEESTPRQPPSDELPNPDALRVTVNPGGPFRFKANAENPLNAQISDSVNLMGGAGVQAEANYQRGLDALRANAAEVVSIIAEEYRDLPEDRYLDRWSLVQLLAELKHASSLAVLDEIISSPIPPEKSRDPHSFTTAGEEVMIRTTAVEAIARIVAAGNQDALELLLKYVNHENFSVKRASIQDFLEHGGQNARERLLKVLPQREHYILDIRRIDVRQAPRIHGEKYLARPETDDMPRASSSQVPPR